MGKIIREEESFKKIRNEFELIVLLYGNILDYDDIQTRFEISKKTFRRDIAVIKTVVLMFFNEDARVIKIKNKLAYILFVPIKPAMLF